MPVYDNYPAVDENNNFPPPIQEALAESPGFKAAFVSKSPMSVNVKDFGAKIDGSSNDLTYINQAIANVGDGGEVHFPPGTCVIAGNIAITGKTVHLVGHGTTLLSTTHNTLVTFTGSWGSVYPVSAATSTTVTHNDETRNVVNLTVNGTLPYKVGDVVKFFADDIIPGARPGSNGLESRVGQFGVVYSVAFNVVTVLVKELLDPMTTNIRISKLNKMGGSMRDFTITKSASLMSDGGKSNTISMVDLYRPTLKNLLIENTPAQAIQITAYGYVIDNVEIQNSTDNSSNSQYGYGILDNSGSYGTITNLRALFVRHAYSDDSPRIATNSVPTYYGRSFANTISLSKGVGNSNTAWDTHAASQDISFIDCEALGSGGPGYGLRGRKHTIRGGRVGASRDWGIYVFSESGTDSDSWGHTIDDVDIEAAVEPLLIAVSKLSAIRETRKTFINNIRFRKPNDQALRFVNATANIGRVVIDDVQMSGSSTHTIKLDNSKVSIENLNVLYKSGLAANNPKGIDLINGSEIKIGYADIDINGTTNGTRFARYIYSDTTSMFKVNRMQFTNGNPTDVADFTATHANSFIEYFASLGNGLGLSSSYITSAGSSVSTATHRLSRSISPFVTLALAISSVYTLDDLRNGTFNGQKVNIMNTGTAALSISHTNKLKTKTGATINVAIGDSANFVWIGGFWIQY